MTKIIIIGMNHETAPVELRECLVSDSDNSNKALNALKRIPCIQEAFYLTTCNRIEALVVSENREEACNALTSLFSDMGNIPEDKFLSSLYTFEDMDAVRHLFMVASSMDSMIVGEPQILGQLKEAYHDAVQAKTSDVILNRLLHRAFHAAKRVRTETGICEAAVSISYAAVELAKKIFHTLENKKILLVGAGEMAELAARQLLSHGVSAMTVANRTLQRAIDLAKQFDAEPVSFDEISAQLQEVDIVIASTAAAEYVITHEQVKTCLRKRRNRPLFFIDIAVPRDVQPEVNKLDNIYVYDIDDLKDVIQMNKANRQQEAIKAERIINEEVVKFDAWLKTLAVVPTIVSLKEKAAAIIENELTRSKSGLNGLTPDQMLAVQTLTQSITDKMLSDPILCLKQASDSSTLNNYLDMAKKLFNLDSE